MCRQPNRGLTVIELLTCLAILSVMLAVGIPGMQNFFNDQAAVASANQVLGLINEGRATAVGSGPLLICADGSDCSSFPAFASGLKLVQDRNNNHLHDPGEKVLNTVQLRQGRSVSWRSFRAKPWLRFSRRGVSWYQNGHFLLCSKDQARKVIMNRQGRARVERDQKAALRCPE